MRNLVLSLVLCAACHPPTTPVVLVARSSQAATLPPVPATCYDRLLYRLERESCLRDATCRAGIRYDGILMTYPPLSAADELTVQTRAARICRAV